MTKTHNFHIPVMGIGFTIDTPLKVSQFGINSVISLVDDILLEKLRKMYSLKYKLHYEEIADKAEDFRARRITSYLNLINQLAEKKFEDLKNVTHEKSNEIKEYFNLLPDSSSLKHDFKELTEKIFNVGEVKRWLNENLSMGSIDVNIMTKIDKDNYSNGDLLSYEYKDAHAALRGYANSELTSSLVLSAGMNPKLYGYIEQFEDFFPNEEGKIKKKIALKVSDYRSALIQGKYLAKKGIWVSEYRIESGLNCGGHAFATDGFLMGPILAEFKANRAELEQSVNEILMAALAEKNRRVPNKPMKLILTAQGGVGTAKEHEFLIEHYEVDSVGWGSPFLLVPEATTVDEPTREKLMAATQKDLYLSDISPLGVPFNSLRGNTKDLEKLALIAKGKPGSLCPKKYLVSNTEYTEKTICTASKLYQNRKLKELNALDISEQELQYQTDKVLDKSCICVGLGTSALVVNGLDTTTEGDGISVCPGPNMAYFSNRVSLKEMVGHIYGRNNVMTDPNRPNMFIKELSIYIDYLKNKVEEAKQNVNKRHAKYLNDFAGNLKDGIGYYQSMFHEMQNRFQESQQNISDQLNENLANLESLHLKIRNLQLSLVKA